MLLPLTDVQTQVLHALMAYIHEKGYPPTVPELSERLGKKNVGGELLALRKKGWATKVPGRSIRGTVPTDEAVKELGQMRLSI